MTWTCPDCHQEAMGDDCMNCGCPYLWTNPREKKMRCLHCGEYHDGVVQVCQGYAWLVHPDGRPPGIHEKAWAEFQSGEIDMRMLDRHNYAYWKDVDIPNDVEWFGLLRKSIIEEREEERCDCEWCR